MTSKSTRERIEWLNYAATGLAANGTEMTMSPQDVIALTECCLAAMDSEPVAWEVKGILCHTLDEANKYVGTPEPLYRHAQPAPVVEEWTDGQCLEFLSIAFRHVEIKGDLATDDIRLGIKMVNACRPVERKAAKEGGSARVHPARNE